MVGSKRHSPIFLYSNLGRAPPLGPFDLPLVATSAEPVDGATEEVRPRLGSPRNSNTWFGSAGFMFKLEQVASPPGVSSFLPHLADVSIIQGACERSNSPVGVPRKKSRLTGVSMCSMFERTTYRMLGAQLGLRRSPTSPRSPRSPSHKS